MRRERQTHRVQLWPGGQTIEYQGDPDGHAYQRRLRTPGFNDAKDSAWRKGTQDEWRKLKIELRAELYQRNLIYGCDSALVDDLIKASDELGGSDLGRGFSIDEIRNIYRDPSDWDAAQCREYLSDHGTDAPDVPVIDCTACDGSGSLTDDQESTKCTTCDGRGSVLDQDADDDTRYVDELREAVREYSQENPAEVFEWWRVDSWLCDQLHEIGKVTIDNGYGHWWGRTCTGQGLIMDGTLQQIAALYEEKAEAVRRAERLVVKP